MNQRFSPPSESFRAAQFRLARIVRIDFQGYYQPHYGPDVEPMVIPRCVRSWCLSNEISTFFDRTPPISGSISVDVGELEREEAVASAISSAEEMIYPGFLDDALSYSVTFEQEGGLDMTRWLARDCDLLNPVD